MNLDSIKEQVDRAYEEWLHRVAPDPKKRAVLRMHQDLVNIMRTHRLIYGCDISEDLLWAKYRGCAS